MTTIRLIRRVIKSKPTLEGAGVRLRRAFGFSEVPLFDPFLLMDDFRGNRREDYINGFPWHPHRGIETITYVLAGEVDHGDSMGNKGAIGPGDVQWMTAGSGIIHQEMPRGDSHERMWGFQLWANLPARQKMMPPRYRDIMAAQIPEVALANGVRVKVICGSIEGTVGPVKDIVVDPSYLDISLPAGSEFTLPTTPGHTAFAYIYDGQVSFCRDQAALNYEIEGQNYFDLQDARTDHLLGNGSLVLFGDGDQIAAHTGNLPARFLFVAGKPLKEPVAWYGPIVMNTREELQLAFDEYSRGTFIKH